MTLTTEKNQKNKHAIWDALQSINDGFDAFEAQYRATTHPQIEWRGAHPFNAVDGAGAVWAQFWQPLMHAIPNLKRNTLLLFGGHWDDADWVTAHGYLYGTFANDWLGIPANNWTMYLRFGEHMRVEDGVVVQSCLLLDIVDFIRQTGTHLLEADGGDERMADPPAREHGIVLAPQDPAESQRSLDLVQAMITGLMAYDGKTLASMGQNRYWHPEMVWYGPGGIGTTYGLDGFEDHHQRPFLQAFPDRKGGGKNHYTRIAEGPFVASGGWPSVVASHQGTYLRHAPTGRPITMRVMDWWTREDDRLTENWVMIDMLDIFLQMGDDVLDDYISEKARIRA